MMTRITLALDRDLVRALERLAQAENVSVSELVASELKVAVRRDRSFRHHDASSEAPSRRDRPCAGPLHRLAMICIASRSSGILCFR